MTVVQAARMFDRFHAFDAIKDDAVLLVGAASRSRKPTTPFG
jgi:hypothetical protein